ncbi:ATP-binding protein [Lichenifustis flavocetrariae]|uniref:histidine kinase n=1 Tax=Lichenifustis flavocetrariae TaxID=2949735 RepID=A0AA41YYU3_9HYPH|nr:ATP-binding protein [Lichenifustis flavocetrariae]MCW6509598.1 ATP-binding protein [Lichenifustis flavocetrariae]
MPPLRVLLAASLIVPALLFAGAAWQERRVLMGEAARRAEKTAEVLEQHAGAAFNAYELIFARIAEHLRAVPDESEAARHIYLAGIDHELRQVGSLFLVDANGEVTAHSRYFPVQSSNVMDRDYFRALRDAAGAPAVPTASGSRSSELDISGLAVGMPVTGRFSGTPKLNIARAITSPDGQFAGAIAISVSLDYFEAFFRTLSGSSADTMVLVRSDGAVLARSPALSGDQSDRLRDPDLSRAILTHIANTTTAYTSPVDKVERIAAYRKLAAYPIYVGYGLGTESVLGRWRGHLVIYGGVALLAALTLSGVTWLALRAAREEDRARASLVSEMARREAVEGALRQAQKMEAVGQLTGGIAHDFNNLLGVVLGNLELLSTRLPEDSRLRRYVDRAIEGTERGAVLTQRMLAFARRQDLKLEPVDVTSLVRGMADLLARSIGSTIKMELRFPARLTSAQVDANQLEMALLNLVVNARDAMPKGGTIVISGREEVLGPGNPQTLTEGRYVVLAVSDTGVGMDAATLTRAAEPFFTTKPVGKGTGLGLAMVHGLAAQAGGTLRIDSEPGHGTTVELWLPQAVGEAEAAPVPAMAHRETSIRPCRVLLVDDDPLVLAGTAAMLDDLGHHVIEARSGDEAVAVISAGTAIDLVITDHVMPGMTGIELASRIRTLRPGLPIVLASGFAELSEVELSQLARLPKPFTLAALSQAVAATLQEREPETQASTQPHRSGGVRV